VGEGWSHELRQHVAITLRRTVIQAAGSAQRAIFAKVADVDVWELSFRVADEVAHDCVFIEPDEDDLGETRNTSECSEWMPYHGLMDQLDDAK
jgi:hypothetical protein